LAGGLGRRRRLAAAVAYLAFQPWGFLSGWLQLGGCAAEALQCLSLGSAGEAVFQWQFVAASLLAEPGSLSLGAACGALLVSSWRAWSSSVAGALRVVRARGGQHLVLVSGRHVGEALAAYGRHLE